MTGAEVTGAAVTGAELTNAEVADLITDRVIAHVMADGEPMPGVTVAIALLERYGLPLAIASSSPPRLIDAVCDRLGLAGIDVRCSAMDEIRGKPAPDVYLTAARRLGVDAASCLALEDSPHGVASAKAAGMRCVAVPDPLLAADPGSRAITSSCRYQQDAPPRAAGSAARRRAEVRPMTVTPRLASR